MHDPGSEPTRSTLHSLSPPECSLTICRDRMSREVREVATESAAGLSSPGLNGKIRGIWLFSGKEEYGGRGGAPWARKIQARKIQDPNKSELQYERVVWAGWKRWPGGHCCAWSSGHRRAPPRLRCDGAQILEKVPGLICKGLHRERRGMRS